MIKITIEIDVKNYNEIIKSEKGPLVAGLASLFKGSENKVDETIKEEVTNKLKLTLGGELEKNGIEAVVKVY